MVICRDQMDQESLNQHYIHIYICIVDNVESRLVVIDSDEY